MMNGLQQATYLNSLVMAEKNYIADGTTDTKPMRVGIPMMSWSISKTTAPIGWKKPGSLLRRCAMR